MKNLCFEELSLEQKIGMLYCARPLNYVRSDIDDLEFTLELIRKHALGCVQVLPSDREAMRRIREMADYPLLIICDTERGFPTSKLPAISLMTLSACDRPEYFRVFAKGVVTEAKAAGYNGTWGPVIDVLSTDGPCKVRRRFSYDPMRVARGAEEIASVYKSYGYLSCGKHYPGSESDLPFDTHMTPTDSSATLEELMEKDLVPYRYLLERGLLPSIMTDHKKMSAIDPVNAGSYSKAVIDIIRDMGFDGVCFTDSLAMMAIQQQYGEENMLGLAIAAGNDVVLPDYRCGVRENFEKLVRNYKNGLFSEERLNEAVRRVLKAQEFVSKEPECSDPFTQEDRAVFDCMAKECITAVCDEGVDAALEEGKVHLFVILLKGDATEQAASMEIGTDDWYRPAELAQKIREVYPDAGVLFLPELPRPADNEKVFIESVKYDDVVFITCCETLAYLGTDCLTRRVESVIDCINLSGKLGAVVHFGNPFALQHLIHVPRKIFGYDMPETQAYTIDVLAGKLPARGKLPFQVEFK